ESFRSWASRTKTPTCACSFDTRRSISTSPINRGSRGSAKGSGSTIWSRTSPRTRSSEAARKKTKPTPIIEALSFTVADADKRDRLDKLVVTLLARGGESVSRATVQRWIEQGRVLVDDKRVRPSASVAAGTRIRIAPAPPPPSSAVPDPSIVLRVVYEDEAL